MRKDITSEGKDAGAREENVRELVRSCDTRNETGERWSEIREEEESESKKSQRDGE